MKRFLGLLLAGVMMVGLAGCASKEDQLVSKTPFPEFADPDMEGNEVTNDIFSQYDATIVNFWNNG